MKYKATILGLLAGVLVGIVHCFAGWTIYTGQHTSYWVLVGESSLFPLIGAIVGYWADQRRSEVARLRLQDRQLRILHAINRAASQSPDLDNILTAALEATLIVMEIDAGSIQLLEADSETINLRAHRGLSEAFAQSISAGSPQEGLVGRTIAAGHPVAMNIREYATEYPSEYLARSDANEGLQSVVCVPLLAKACALGVMNLGSHRPDAWPLEELDFLASIGRQLGIAIENALLHETTQERATRLELIADIGRRTTAILKPDDLLHQAVGLIRDAFGYYSVQVLLTVQEDIVLAASSLPALQTLENQLRLQIGKEGITGWVAGSGEPLLVPDVTLDDRYYSVEEEKGVRSELAVPIKLRGEIIGVLDVQSSEPNVFVQIDVFTLQTIADQLVVAIENSRLYETTQERVARLELIGRIGQGTTAILGIDELLHQAVTLIHNTFGYYSVQVLLTEGEHIALAASSHPALQTLEGAIRFEIGTEGICGWVAASGEPLLVPDVSQEPRYVRRLKEVEEGKAVRAELAVPIRLKGEIIGVLDTQSTKLDAFSQIDLFTLQTIADQLAIAIANSRLYENMRERATRLELVAGIGRRTTAILELNELLHQAVNLLRDTFGYYSVQVFLVESEHIVLTATSHPLAQRLEGNLRLQIGKEGITGWVAGTGEPLLVSDISQNDRYYNTGETPGTQSELAVPIKLRGEIIGVLNAQSKKTNAFSQVDTFTLQAIADQLAVAIENGRLYEAARAYATELEKRVVERTAELRREKERAEAILRSAADAVIILDAEGLIISANPAFETQTGYQAEEVIGKHPRQLAGLEPSSSIIERLREVVLANLSWREEINVQRKDGTTYEAELNVAPLRQDGDEPRGYVAVMRDISALKEVERMKDAFVADVSHELRTPITSLKLYHDLMLTNPEKSALYMARLRREIDRLEHIIEDLLRLSRLDQGQEELTLKPVDLNALASQYVTDRQPLAQGKGLSLSFSRAPKLPAVQGDERLLGQALSILITNALNYTPSGGQVSVATQLCNSNGKPWVGFSVSDTGPGILPDEQPRLFERFFRGQAGRESGVEGTGLGLSIVKEIVDRHQGRVEVASEGVLGKGATFSIWLPVEVFTNG